MAFNVQKIKSAIGAGGVLQNNKYDVKIFFPLGSPMGGSFLNLITGQSKVGFASDGQLTAQSKVTEDLSYRCVNATLPGLNIRTSDVSRWGFGLQEKMPINASYNDCSLDFVCDRYGSAFKFWYSWMNYIFSSNGEETNNIVDRIFGQGNVISELFGTSRQFYTSEFKDNYAATVVITLYDASGNKAVDYYLYKAFPIGLNDINLSWGNTNELVKIGVKMTFREAAINDGILNLFKNGAMNIASNLVDTAVSGAISTFTKSITND